MDISCHDCRLRKGNATVLTGATIFDRSSGEHLTVAEGWDGKEGLATAVMDFAAYCSQNQKQVCHMTQIVQDLLIANFPIFYHCLLMFWSSFSGRCL